MNDALVQRMRDCGYELLELLGRGGMGRVWRAHERKLARDVAIKFVTDANTNPIGRQRFLAEARALARVQHPNVVAVYTFGEVGEQPYLAYELVAGVGLDTMVGGLTWPRALAILIDLARGLRAVHDAGVLHRDLKPANAMLTIAGHAKLIDFGLAKILGGEPLPAASALTGESRIAANIDALIHRDASGPASDDSSDWSSERTISMVVDLSALGDAASNSTTAPDAIVGTPRYVAPEIWWGQPASVQTEVYSLGLIAWELLTGHVAHADRHGGALVRAIVDEPLERVAELAPGVPAGLAAIIDRAVDKQPKGRQASAEQLCTELEQIADSLHALRLLPEPSRDRPRDDPAHADEQRAALVRASLTRVLADGQFGPRFYARLFEHHPELRPLFPATLRDQAIKLADALRLAVSLLRDPPTLEATLSELGARHVLYGVDESQLDHVRDTLIELLAEIEGEQMTEELLDAWVWTWGRLDQAFRSGMRRATLDPAGSRSTSRDASERATTPMPATRWVRCGSTSVAYRTLAFGSLLVSKEAIRLASPVPGEARHGTPSRPVARRSVPSANLTASAKLTEELSRDPLREHVIDLVVVPSWFGHGELAWRSPEYVRMLAGLAEHARVTVFDRRGTGLSDRPLEPLSLESSLAEIDAVLDAIEARVVVLLGLQDGGVLAARYAAMPEHGGRTCGWIGWGIGPRGLPPARVEPLCAAIDREWGEPLFAELVAPSRAGEPEFRRDWSDLLRNGASPTSAQALLRFAATLELDAAIAKPGLVIHRSEDRWMPIAGAREAAAITGARLAELPGRDHLPWIGDGDQIVTTIAEFLTRLPC